MNLIFFTNKKYRYVQENPKVILFHSKNCKKTGARITFPWVGFTGFTVVGEKHRPGSISTCTTCNNHGLATGVGSWYLWIPMEKLSNHSPIGFPHLQNKHGTILLILLTVNYSGQISSRPHTTDFPQMVVNCKGNPRLFQGNLGWWNIMNHLVRYIFRCLSYNTSSLHIIFLQQDGLREVRILSFDGIAENEELTETWHQKHGTVWTRHDQSPPDGICIFEHMGVSKK